MTALARFRRRPLPLLLGALLVLAPMLLAPATAAPDDFEFGQALAKARYFDFARRVYTAILEDDDATDEEKDLARYGLAGLASEEALAATGRPDVPYKEVERLFSQSVDQIAEFARKNPDNENADRARLEVGTIRLAFVQWARELEQDDDEMEARGTTAREVRQDARQSVTQAIEYFGELKPAPDNYDPTPLQSLARYYWTISQYYLALTHEPCSAAALSALENAGDKLEGYIMENDGQLLAVYAQDIYGLVFWERAKCASDVEEKQRLYGSALEWFVTCVDTPNEGPDFLRVITSGYYHIAQVGLDAGRMPDRNFHQEALHYLEDMLRRQPTAWRTENGLRALVEWSKLECERGDAARAVQVAKEAAERARTAGMGYMERLAGRQLSHYVSGGCGTSPVGQDPEVLMRVADDLLSQGRLRDAILAFRNVVAAAPDTPAGFLTYKWKAWEQMARAYRQLGDRLGEAMAYEPIHTAWVNGLIPREEDAEGAGPNEMRAGDDHRLAQEAMKTVAEVTGSPVFDARYREMRTEFPEVYPNHPAGRASEWNTAIDKYNAAREKKKAGDPTWVSDLEEARRLFRNVATDMKAQMQDVAWTRLVMSYLLLEEKPAKALEVGKEAFAYWEHPDRIAQAERYDAVRARREEAKAGTTVWMAQAQLDLDQAADAEETLKGYHGRYPDAKEPYPAMAYGLLAKANVATGDIDEADRYFRILLAEHPNYFDLPGITVRLAQYYNDKRSEIEEELRGVTQQLNEKQPALSEARREALRVGGLLGDKQGELNKANQALELERQAEAGAPGVVAPDAGVLREAREKKPVLEAEIADLQKQLVDWVEKRDRLEKEVEKLQERKGELEQEIYEPLVKAAGYYKAWDDTLEPRDRDPDNVVVFAQWFWYAGTLRPDVASNWRNARELYEDYLAFDQVRELPVTDATKQRALGRLGDVYVNLAERAEDEGVRRDYVARAVDLLQNAVAKDPADNDLVIGMLANRYLVLEWTHPTEQRIYRFPIPSPGDVAQLRAHVEALRAGQDPLPRYDDPERQRRQQRALDLFKREVEGTTDAELRPLVARAGFNPTLYRDLANSSPEFMLALAWAYSETGRPEDAVKAVNLVLGLTKTRALGVEEDTELWWRANNILLRTYVNAAAQGATAGTVGGDAAQWLERAGRHFQGLAALYPDLGEGAIPGNRSRMMALLERLNRLRGRAGLPPVTIQTPTDAAATGGNG